MDKNYVTAVLRTRGSPDDHQTKVKRNGSGVFKEGDLRDTAWA